jgi:hypothetical protein
MDLIDVPKDGNCLFSSLAVALGLSPSQIRQLIVNFVSKNLQMKLDGGETIDYWLKSSGHHCIHTYQVEMGRNGRDGEGFEIAIASKIFQRKIVVWIPTTEKGGIKKIAEYGENKPAIHLYYASAHYQIIRFH